MTIKCDKCDSTNVMKTEITRITPKKPKPLTMSEHRQLPKYPSITMENKIYKWALTCLDCGHRIEYWK